MYEHFSCFLWSTKSLTARICEYGVNFHCAHQLEEVKVERLRKFHCTSHIFMSATAVFPTFSASSDQPFQSRLDTSWLGFELKSEANKTFTKLLHLRLNLYIRTSFDCVSSAVHLMQKWTTRIDCNSCSFAWKHHLSPELKEESYQEVKFLQRAHEWRK